MKEPDWRLFVALPLPVEVLRAIASRTDGLRARHNRTRWVRAESLHITVLFLGGTPSARVPELQAALMDVAGRHKAFELALGHGGGRARGGNEGVAWIEVSTGAEPLSQLAADLSAALLPGVPRSRWRGHVTIARCAPPALIGELADWQAPDVAWRADRIVLNRSHLGGESARYESIGEALLRKS